MSPYDDTWQEPPSSLVRGTKSSTDDPDAINWLISEALGDAQDAPPAWVLDPVEAAPPAHIDQPKDLVDEMTAGRVLTLKCENWMAIERTDEGAPYTPLDPEHAVRRAVITTQTRGKVDPPRHHGDRWTAVLTERGKKAIDYSARYMHRIGRGYRTFLTLTFTPEWRAQLEKWDLMPHGSNSRRSIGALVTEFLNVLQMAHKRGLKFAGHYRRKGKQQRGGGYTAKGSHYTAIVKAWSPSARWTPIAWRDPIALPAHDRPFEFVWVAECPKNAEGENNPHVHLMMNWHAKLDEFHAWARWLEATWGKGFAKLERIKKPAAAASYMAKAAHYLTKGAEGKQGTIRGNRYGIANTGRAPRARVIGRYFADWIRDAVKVGVEAGREKWPKGVWFHEHGFGASTRSGWGRLLTALKGDGFAFQPAPPNLLAARTHNVFQSLHARLSGHWAQYREAIFSNLEFSH